VCCSEPKHLLSHIPIIFISHLKNNPLYVRNFSTRHPDLKYHYIAHTSCDVIEERGKCCLFRVFVVGIMLKLFIPDSGTYISQCGS